MRFLGTMINSLRIALTDSLVKSRNDNMVSYSSSSSLKFMDQTAER